MVFRHLARASAHGRATWFSGAIALVAVSAGGVAVSLVVWAVRGWVDGLACYVATIGILGALLVRLTSAHGQRATASPVFRHAASADAGPELASSLSPNIATTLGDAEGGLHRFGG